MPFFFGCLWRESWLLPTLLSVLASASREAPILKTHTWRKTSVPVGGKSEPAPCGQPTLLRHCARRRAVCASSARCAASAVGRSRT